MEAELVRATNSMTEYERDMNHFREKQSKLSNQIKGMESQIHEYQQKHSLYEQAVIQIYKTKNNKNSTKIQQKSNKNSLNY